MEDLTKQKLRELTALVQQAKQVPLSASCMLNRAEALALIEEISAALAVDLAAANRLTEKSFQTLERAQAEAEQIIKAAEERGKYLATQTPVMIVARQKAAQLEERSIAEAEGLRREADAYVDSRIAALEAALQKTMLQIKTMRARLASRSGLDEGDTTTLPRLD